MLVHISDISDPRIEPYRLLKERELARKGNRFIAEGEYIVRRLIESDYPVESLLLSKRRAEEIAPVAPARAPVYVASEELLRQIIGFNFHSGVLAVGVRKPPADIDQILSRESGRKTLVICPETSSHENMGAMIRIAAAFGVDAMVLGGRCCDPFWRRSIRVSMGTIFSLPLVLCDDLLVQMPRLRQRWGFEFAAAVLDKDAQPLHHASRGARLAILLGNEAQGLGHEFIRACDRHITIPMRPGIDSLNVSAAAGIILHHFVTTARDVPRTCVP